MIFFFEGKEGIDGVGVLDTPSTSSGNLFSFLFTVAFHIFVFYSSCLSMIMLLPQVYMILKQKKLKGFVAAIALFKQASETTAVPVQHNTVQTAWSHKSRATVNYTLIGVEPHRPTRGVWPIAAVANDSQLHLVAPSI